MTEVLNAFLISAGTVSQYTIQNDSTADPRNWSRPSDMPAGWGWDEVVTVGEIVDGDFIRSLDQSGKFKGGMSGTFEWFTLTAGMIAQIDTDIFASAPTAAVTIQVYHQIKGWIVINCTLDNPFSRAQSGAGTKQTDDEYSNVKFNWMAGTQAVYGRAFSSAFSSAFG